ncbi:hypothetical protein [Lysinibacillus sp. 54212]|uniref:hypothetical protein n=1 Tax=Lysinibacillus sp. 54212 TaxID=3119829 RepID=UPI002FC720F3
MIKQIFAFEDLLEYERYADDIKLLNKKLAVYKELLINRFELVELPKSIVWTSSENATSVFSQVPVPAYTNRDLIFMSPSVKEWRDFYLSQLENEGLSDTEEVLYIKNYFQAITIDHVFCILAHELTHHIELFPDEFEDERGDSIWFEEGMCEYLSQKLTLTNEQFTELRTIDEHMIQLFKPKYGQFGLDHFGSGSYGHASLAAIMLNYWRSASAIQYLVEECYEGDVLKVFEKYQEWHANGRGQLLTDFFGVSDF